MTELPSAGLRYLAVHAHPDDEASKGAPVMARYVAEGAEVMVATCTGGERGDIHNPALVGDDEILANIAEVRRREMATAAEILGVSHTWLGFIDSGFPEGAMDNREVELPADAFARQPLSETVPALVKIIRQFRPHIMTTYDENGGYPHPDHIMCHVVSMAAFEAAGDPDAYPECGPAWQPIKVYYNSTFSRNRMQAMHDAIIASGAESPFAEWLERWSDRPDRPVHAQIECKDFYHAREDALRAHATQIDPDGFFFAVSAQQMGEIWPTEEFELGKSLIPTDEVETDLFAGIRGTELVVTGGGPLLG